MSKKEDRSFKASVSRLWGERRHHDEIQFRVWPDGTVQSVEDGEPYSHMSDDYALVWAFYEDLARDKVINWVNGPKETPL